MKDNIAASNRKQQRDKLESDILVHAVKQFAEFGYQGSSIASIAGLAGISKQNLLYYFPTKQQLYQRVLDDVLDEWLLRMSMLADTGLEPLEVLQQYIRAKLRFSREQPWASRVYALEVISGAKIYSDAIRAKVIPLLRQDIMVFEKWIAQGKIAPVDPTHLLFAIWAMTQSYADFSAQMCLVMGRQQLSESDFEAAETLICNLVLSTLTVPELAQVIGHPEKCT